MEARRDRTRDRTGGKMKGSGEDRRGRVGRCQPETPARRERRRDRWGDGGQGFAY